MKAIASAVRSPVKGRLFVLVLLAVLSGCAAVPMAPVERDAEAKKFLPKPDLARIYLYRNETFGAAIPMTVSLNSRTVGQSGPQTYFMWDVPPGKHTIASHAENVSSLTIDAQAGKAYYIWQEVKMGLWMARSLLQQVDDETGRKGVLECNMAQASE